MKNRQKRINWAVLIGALVGMQATATTVRAESTNTAVLPGTTISIADTNTLELIKQLQRRIEELEQKVKTLEGGKAPPEAPSDAKSQQQIQQLGQEVKILERQRELDQEDKEAKAKEAPRINIGGDGFSLASARGDRKSTRLNSSH